MICLVVHQDFNIVCSLLLFRWRWLWKYKTDRQQSLAVTTQQPSLPLSCVTSRQPCKTTVFLIIFPTTISHGAFRVPTWWLWSTRWKEFSTTGHKHLSSCAFAQQFSQKQNIQVLGRSDKSCRFSHTLFLLISDALSWKRQKMKMHHHCSVKVHDGRVRSFPASGGQLHYSRSCQWE